MSVSPDASGRGRPLQRFEPAGLLYGATVSGATLGTISAHDEESTRVAIVTLVVLAVYWLVHVYIHALSMQLGGADTRLLFHRTIASARHEVGVLVGGLPAVVIYVALAAMGVEPTSAGFMALFVVVFMLFGVGYVGARKAGLTGPAALIEAAFAGLFGVLIIVLQTLLH